MEVSEDVDGGGEVSGWDREDGGEECESVERERVGTEGVVVGNR